MAHSSKANLLKSKQLSKIKWKDNCESFCHVSKSFETVIKYMICSYLKGEICIL